MRPILTRSEITGSVYIATGYKLLGSGELDTHEKYEVTEEFDAIAGGIVVENAKLRELVRDMWAVLSYSTECRLICKHGRECYRENECVFEKCTRELGIEADG